MTQAVESPETFETIEAPEAPIRMKHGISPDFSSDAALIELLNRYPAELFDINRYSYDKKGKVSLETGSRGTADGAAVLEAIKRGELWVNLRGIEKAHPALWKEIRTRFKNVASRIGAKGAAKMTGQLILSSPTTKVPYHFDPAGVVLFHLRGRKRIWIYPTVECFLPQEAMEKVIMRTTTEELYYMQRYDAAAKVLDLGPGQAVTWPLYSPHRVENLDGLCVSLSMDFQTWHSRITNGCFRANGVLRAWGFRPRQMEEISPLGRTTGWLLSLAFKRLGFVKNNIKHFKRTFVVAETLPAEPEKQAA